MPSDSDELPTKQPAIDEQKVKDKYRLHLSVPKPLSRINMGMPWYERLRGTNFDSSVPKFGYKGLSAQADSHLFIDIHKTTFFNSKKSVLMQSGKYWNQYATKSTWLATLADATFASDARMTLVAGAGQGQRQPIDHGIDPDLDAYNDLYLHYHVDSVMMGVSEAMTGRRERDEKDNLSAWLRSPWGAEEFRSSNDHLVKEPQTVSGLDDPRLAREGLWDLLKEASLFLGQGLPDFEGLYKIFPPYKDGTKHEKYGYGKQYFTAFDPYALKKIYDELPDWQKMILWLKNAATIMKRFADVTAKVAVAVEHLPLVRQTAKLIKAVDTILSSADSGERLAEALGAGQSTNEDGVLFGHQRPAWEQMQGAFDSCWKQLDGASTKAFETKQAYVEYYAPANEGDPAGPPYVWRDVPAGIAGYIKSDVGDEDDDKMYTFVVPGKKAELKAKSSFEPVTERPASSSVSIRPRPVITGSVTLTLPAEWAAPGSPATAAPLMQWFAEQPLLGDLVSIGYGRRSDAETIAEALPGADDDTPAEILDALADTAAATKKDTRITIDPTSIPLFESLTLSGDELLSAMGFEGPLELTGERSSAKGVSLESLAETLRSSGPVTLSWELARQPLDFSVVWTADNTSSAPAAAGAVQQGAVDAGLPRELVVAKASYDDQAAFVVVGPEVKGVPDTLGLNDYRVTLTTPDSSLLEVTPESEGKVKAKLKDTRWGDARWISVSTETHSAYVALTPANAGSLASIVAEINDVAGEDIAKDEGGKLKIKSLGYGSSAFAEVRADRNSTLTDTLGFSLPAPEASVVREQGEDISLTPEELKKLIQGDRAYSGAKKKSDGSDYHGYDAGRIKVDVLPNGGIKITSLVSSESDSYSSYVAVGDKLFDKVSKGKSLKGFVKKKDAMASLDDFRKFLGAVAAIPKEMGEVLRPLTDMVEDVVALQTAVTKGLIAAQEAIMGSKYVPGAPPSAIGLFAKDGISLGTPDKIVSAAGKGYVFIADGGTGQRDAEKFVLGDYEKYISNFAANEIKGFGDLAMPEEDSKPEKEKSGDAGFTVLSNSNASVVTRSSLDLLAIGSMFKDGKVYGRGVARLAGTRSVEVAGHSRVVVAATASKDPNKAVAHKRLVEKADSGHDYETVGVEEGKHGGEVELLAETVRVGVPLLHRGHMSLADKIPWPHGDETKLKIPVAERSYAPPTKSVEIGAAKQVEAATLPFHLLVKATGAFLGGAGGIDDEAFDDRKTREVDRLNAHFDEQELYWKTVKDAAVASKLEAEVAVRELEAELRKGKLKAKRRGIDFAGWKKLKDYYGDKKTKAEATISKISDARTDAYQDLLDRFDAISNAPSLLMKVADDGEKIFLGFRTANAGEWGPHLKITPESITLSMSSTGTDATLKLESGKVELRPGAGSQAKLTMQDGDVKMKGTPAGWVHLTGKAQTPNGVI
jgi:hypothetical protein